MASNAKWSSVCLVVSLLTDAVNGETARRLRQKSAAGARLDGVADLASFVALPLCLWWLWPDVMRREAIFVAGIIASYGMPLLAGWIKLRRQTSYHTWDAKLAEMTCGLGAILLFTEVPPWLFRVGVVILAMGAAGEIAITLTLKRLHARVPSLWLACTLARG